MQLKKNEGTLEQQIQNLEIIVRQLENDEMGIEEALKLYENGKMLAQEIQKKLEALESKIQVLETDGSLSNLKGEDLDEL